MNKTTIIAFFLLSSLFIIPFQTSGEDKLLPEGGTPGNPVIVDLSTSNNIETYTDFHNWECVRSRPSNPPGIPCETSTYNTWFRGVEVEVDDLLSDYSFDRTLPDIDIHIGDGYGKDCGGWNCDDGTDIKSFDRENAIYDINLELVQNFDPLLKITAESWYSHQVTFGVTDGYTEIETEQRSLMGGISKASFSSGTGNKHSSTDLKTLSWPVTNANPGETIYIYHEVYYLRIYGSATFDYTTRNNQEVENFRWEFDELVLLLADYTDRQISLTKYGEFPEPEDSFYQEKSNGNPQVYTDYPISVNTQQKKSTTEFWTKSTSIGGSKYDLNLRFTFTKSGAQTVNSGISVTHTFTSTSETDWCGGYMIKYLTSWETELECAEPGPYPVNHFTINERDLSIRTATEESPPPSHHIFGPMVCDNMESDDQCVYASFNLDYELDGYIETDLKYYRSINSIVNTNDYLFYEKNFYSDPQGEVDNVDYVWYFDLGDALSPNENYYRVKYIMKDGDGNLIHQGWSNTIHWSNQFVATLAKSGSYLDFDFDWSNLVDEMEEAESVTLKGLYIKLYYSNNGLIDTEADSLIWGRSFDYSVSPFEYHRMWNPSSTGYYYYSYSFYIRTGDDIIDGTVTYLYAGYTQIIYNYKSTGGGGWTPM